MVVFTNVYKEKHLWGFSGGPVVRTWDFHAMGPGSVPDQGTRIPQHGGKKKKRLRNKRKKISAKGRVGEGEYERDFKGTIYRS